MGNHSIGDFTKMIESKILQKCYRNSSKSCENAANQLHKSFIFYLNSINYVFLSNLFSNTNILICYVQKMKTKILKLFSFWYHHITYLKFFTITKNTERYNHI